MLTERIIGAFTFRQGVYAEVEKDLSFTSTAWLIVIVVSFLNKLGTVDADGFGARLIAAVVATIGSVVGFALGALVINWVGRSVFNADVSFDELVRTLGLAYVWQIVGLIGVFSGFLACLLLPALIVAWILGLIAWFVATKEALDLEWGQTIVTVIIGWLVFVVVGIIFGLILAAVGLTAGVLGF
jgi:hypothetical protein